MITAYAAGASYSLVKSDIEALSEVLGSAAGIAALFSGPAGVAADAAIDAAAFKPILDQADREAMRKLILVAGPTIDEALDRMALSAETHFAHVATAETIILLLDRTAGVDAARRDALKARTARIRTLLANWVALIEQQREALVELRRASEKPNRLETRLGDLAGATAPAIRLKAVTVAAMAAELGTALPLTAVALEVP